MRSGLGLVQLAMCLTIVTVVLATVKRISISGGPTSDDAIAAIRVAQRDLFEIQRSQPSVATPKLNDAHGALNLAWKARKDKRFEDAIAAALKSSDLSKRGG